MTARRRFSASSPLRKAAAKPDVRWIPLGVVIGTHGLRGSLRVKQWNDDSDLLFDADEIALRLNGELLFHRVIGVREASKGLLVDLEAVRSVEAAEALRGAELCLPRELLPPLEEGEYYFVDLGRDQRRAARQSSGRRRGDGDLHLAATLRDRSSSERRRHALRRR